MEKSLNSLSSLSSSTEDEKINLRYICENFKLNEYQTKIVENLRSLKSIIIKFEDEALKRERMMKFRDFDFYLSVSEIKCNISVLPNENGIKYSIFLFYQNSYRNFESKVYPEDSAMNRIDAFENLYDIFGIEKPTRAKYTKIETQKMQKLLFSHQNFRSHLIENVWFSNRPKKYTFQKCILSDRDMKYEYIELIVMGKKFQSESYPTGYLEKGSDFYKHAMLQLYCQSIPLFVGLKSQ